MKKDEKNKKTKKMERVLKKKVALSGCSRQKNERYYSPTCVAGLRG